MKLIFEPLRFKQKRAQLIFAFTINYFLTLSYKMSSIGSVIAQRPYRAKNFVVLSDAALAFPATSVEAAAPVGASQVVGSVITFPTLATAVATASGCLLNGGVAMSTGLALNGNAAVAITVGQELRDMGRYVTVYNGPSHVYTLALVQSKNDAAGTTEGVGGSQATTAGEGYTTFYVLINTNLPTTQAGVLTVGVARV
jgi:hypothetical protein